MILYFLLGTVLGLSIATIAGYMAIDRLLISIPLVELHDLREGGE